MEITFSILGVTAALLFGLLVVLTVSPKFSAQFEAFVRTRGKKL